MRQQEKDIVVSFIGYTVFWAGVMASYLSGFVKPNLINLAVSAGFLFGFLKRLELRLDDYVESLLHGSSA